MGSISNSGCIMSLKARTLQNGKIAIFDLRGALVGDVETDALREATADFIEQGNTCLILNLQKVTYVNSSGVGAIIAAHTSYARRGGSVKLVGITGMVQNLLAVTRLVDVFEVFDTVQEAIESFGTVKSQSSS